MQLYGLDQNDYLDLKLFGSHESTFSHSNKGLSLLNSMTELNYVKFDHSLERLALTQAGMNYMDQHFEIISDYIKEHNVQLSDFGEMAGYIAPMWNQLNGPTDPMYAQLHNNNVLKHGTKTDEFFNEVPDWDNVRFKGKNYDNGSEPMD